MDLISLIFLALGLSMDAFAVSISNSMCFELKKRDSFLTSLSFGIFQGIMPIAGFFAGIAFSNTIESIDHWIAFILLAFIGGKMIFDSLREWNEPISCPVEKTLTVKMVLLQGVATSIDALAVGVGFAVMEVNIWVAAGLIALITFVCCLVGHFIGKKAGGLLGNWAQIAGGVILIVIGLKILISHLIGA